MVIRHDLYEHRCRDRQRTLNLEEVVGSKVSTNSAVFSSITAKVIGTSRTGN